MKIDKLFFLLLVFSIGGIIQRGVPFLSMISWQVYKLIVVFISIWYFGKLYCRPLKRNEPLNYYTFFLIICIVWMLFNDITSGLSSFSALLAGMMPIFSGYYLSRFAKVSEKQIVMALMFFLLVAVLSFYGYANTLNEVYGDRDVTNNMGYYFVSTVSIVFIFNNRFWSYGAIVIIAFYVLLSAKRGAMVCTIVAFLIYYYYVAFLNKKKKTTQIVVLSVFSAILSLLVVNFLAEDSYTSERIYESFSSEEGNAVYSGRDVIYASLWDIIKNSGATHLLFGHGTDATVKLIGIHAHNDWLEIMIDYGAIGIISYLSFFVSIFIYIRKQTASKYKYIVITIITVLLLQTFFSMGFTSLSMSVTSFILGCSIGKLDNQKYRYLIQLSQARLLEVKGN